jgi:hypothetical protein
MEHPYEVTVTIPTISADSRAIVTSASGSVNQMLAFQLFGFCFSLRRHWHEWLGRRRIRLLSLDSLRLVPEATADYQFAARPPCVLSPRTVHVHIVRPLWPLSDPGGWAD